VPPEEHYDPSAATGHNQSGQATTEAMDPEEKAGTVIGRYHVLQRIGDERPPWSRKARFALRVS